MFRPLHNQVRVHILPHSDQADLLTSDWLSPQLTLYYYTMHPLSFDLHLRLYTVSVSDISGFSFTARIRVGPYSVIACHTQSLIDAYLSSESTTE